MLSITAISGQKISLKDVDIDISYSDYRLTDIIDGTGDEDHLGYVFRGAFNGSIRHIYFHKSITEEFERLLKPKFSKDNDAIPLVIKINSIEINEWSQGFGKKSNVVSLSLSFFQEMDDDAYVLITDRIINNLDLDGVPYNQLPDRIGEGIMAAFDYLDLIVNPSKPQLSWSELWDYQPFEGLPLRSPSDELVVYEHYSDFLEGKKYESSGLKIRTKKTKAFLLNEDETHLRNVWGATYEGKLYLNLGYHLVPLTYKNGSYSHVLKNVDNKNVAESVSVGMAIDKVLGLLSMATAFDKNVVPLSKSTGFLDIKPIYDQSELKDRSHLGTRTILEFAPFGSPDEVLEVKLDNKVLIQLHKGEFFQVPSKLINQDVEVCVDKRCELITVSPDAMFRTSYKKGLLSVETFTEKERQRYIRNVELRYWVGF